MSKNPTWQELSEMLPDCTFGHMWDYFEEDTGRQPKYSEQVPDDIMKIVNS